MTPNTTARTLNALEVRSYSGWLSPTRSALLEILNVDTASPSDSLIEGENGRANLATECLRRFLTSSATKAKDRLTLNHRVPGSSPGAPTKNPSLTVVFGVFASVYPVECNLR
jgi:hypothetical protein